MKKVLSIFIILLLLFVSLNVYSTNSENITISFNNSNSSYSNIKDKTTSFSQNMILTLQENFGDQRDFWTLNYDSGEYEQIHATLLAVGDWCYIYVDNRTIALEGQQSVTIRSEMYAEEFDDTIYPKNIEFMGNPDGLSGDIDGDPRITVLIYPIVSGGGYYLLENELDHEYSNFREMIYVSPVLSSEECITIICHEFNHLILFNSDMNEADFVLEGIAEYSVYHAGYFSDETYLPSWGKLNFSYHAVHFEDHPEFSLFYFDPELSYITYGASYMFYFYLVEQFGIEVITDSLAIESDGPKGLEEALLKNGYSISFNEIYLNWITACTIDQIGVHNDIFGFVNLDFNFAISTRITEFPYSQDNVKHNYYGTDVKKLISPPDNFTLKIETPKSPNSLGISVIIYDENGWNITKSIVPGNGRFTYLYYTGKNIEKAYILTSMIKENVEEAPTDFIEAPFEELDYIISEGYNIPEKSSFDFTTTTILVIFLGSMLLMTRRKKN